MIVPSSLVEQYNDPATSNITVAYKIRMELMANRLMDYHVFTNNQYNSFSANEQQQLNDIDSQDVHQFVFDQYKFKINDMVLNIIKSG